MIVRGSVSPTPLWIRYIDDNDNAIVRLRRNIIEKNVKDEATNIDRIEYEYEECELSIFNRDNLESIIKKDFDSWFQMGLNQMEEKQKEEENRIKQYQLLHEGGQIDLNEQLIEENTKLKVENERLKRFADAINNDFSSFMDYYFIQNPDKV